MPKLLALGKNRLLAALPAGDLERLMPHLERVTLSLGEVLHESGARISHAYFPATSVISLLNVLQDGSSSGIAVVGNDGMVGTAIYMGGNTTLCRAVVQSSGYGYRIKATVLKNEFDGAEAMFAVLMRYTQALLTQITQTAVCNRHHSVAQQLSRWLLLTLDRLSLDSLVVTQQLIADTIGVRREGITEAIGSLQRTDIIRCRRGRIDILDRPALEKTACECYVVVKAECDRLLLPPHAQEPRSRGFDTAPSHHTHYPRPVPEHAGGRPGEARKSS